MADRKRESDQSPVGEGARDPVKPVLITDSPCGWRAGFFSPRIRWGLDIPSATSLSLPLRLSWACCRAQSASSQPWPQDPAAPTGQAASDLRQ